MLVMRCQRAIIFFRVGSGSVIQPPIFAQHTNQIHEGTEEGLKGLLAKLPPDVRKTLEDCDRRGDHESKEFQRASEIFNSHYNCQLKPLPEEVLAIHKHIQEDPTVYVTM